MSQIYPQKLIKTLTLCENTLFCEKKKTIDKSLIFLVKQPSVLSARIASKHDPILSPKLGENFIIVRKYNILQKRENSGQKYDLTSKTATSNISYVIDLEWANLHTKVDNNIILCQSQINS